MSFLSIEDRLKRHRLLAPHLVLACGSKSFEDYLYAIVRTVEKRTKKPSVLRGLSRNYTSNAVHRMILALPKNITPELALDIQQAAKAGADVDLKPLDILTRHAKDRLNELVVA